MVAGVMKVDTAPRWWFFIVAAGAAVILLAALIVGSTGPEMLDTRHSYAYGCPGNSHVWDDKTCTGILMRNGSTWEYTFGEFRLLNKVWLLDITPYKWDANTSHTWRDKDLEFSVSIYGTDDAAWERWKTITVNDTHRMDFTCGKGRECESFTLVDMQYIEYSWYRVVLRLAPSNARALVGDMRFSLFTYDLEFSEMELSLRLCFIFIALIALALFLYSMKGIKYANWTFEQKSAVILTLGLVMYNDIFFPFEFLLRGWFFEFLNSVFEVTFIAGLMLFWLVVIDKTKMDELELKWHCRNISKAILVCIYGGLAIVFFTWIRVRAARDPIYGDRDDLIGPLILFYVVAASYAALLVWLVISLVIAIPTIARRRDLVVRFSFVGVPTSVCVISVLVAIFTGTIGPFNRDALSWVFEATMYNLFVWVLLLGYVPSKTGSEEQETTPFREQELRVVGEPAREYNTNSLQSGFAQHDDL